MAGYRTHLGFSAGVGVVYGGAAAVSPLGFDPQTAFLAAGVTAVGGLLPDLDSNSGVPVRELFGLSAAVVPLLMMPRLVQMGLSQEGILFTLVVAYLVVRYVASGMFKRLSVHRGMFHSLPAMAIAGLCVYLAYDHDVQAIRLLLAGGVMLGFFSHLLLDEIYSVDIRGLRPRLNKFSGSAIKLVSPSWRGTAACYAILGALIYLALEDHYHPPAPHPPQIGIGRVATVAGPAAPAYARTHGGPDANP